MMTPEVLRSPGRRRLLAALPLAALAPATALGQRNAAPYVPTPWPIVDAMLDLAQVRSGDFVIDLGCGDGRLVLTAARRFGARGYGVDINPELVALANRSAGEAGVADRVRFETRDLFETDLRKATVLTLYLLPNAVVELVPRIREQMPAGARVVSHDYPLTPWPPEKHVELDVPEKRQITGTAYTVLFLYIVPARVGGEWRLDLPAFVAPEPARLSITQEVRSSAATVSVAGRTVDVGVSVHGDAVRLALPPLLPGGARASLEGRVRDGSLEGTLDSARGRGVWRASRLGAGSRQPARVR